VLNISYHIKVSIRDTHKKGYIEVYACCIEMFSKLPNVIFIGYWLDMEIYVRVLVRRNIARRQERNINYAPERVHIFPYPNNNLFITYALLSQKKLFDIYCIAFINKISKITSVLNKQKLKFKTKVKQLLPLLFLRLARNMNVYSKEFHS